MRDRFFGGLGRVDQYRCHGEADLLLRCFYFTAFHAVLEMRSRNDIEGEKESISQRFRIFMGSGDIEALWGQGKMQKIQIPALRSGSKSFSRSPNKSQRRSNFAHL